MIHIYTHTAVPKLRLGYLPSRNTTCGERDTDCVCAAMDVDCGGDVARKAWFRKGETGQVSGVGSQQPATVI